MPTYSKPLTLHKGVDNQIQFQFLNQEQKPVDITNAEITCRIISYTGAAVLLKKALTIQYGATGIAVLQVNPAEIEDIDPQQAMYSLSIPSSEFDYPVFVDQNAGGRGDMNIVNSILPSFIPSESISIPTGQSFPNASSNPTTTTYYSSVIGTDNNPILTIQAEFTDFYGNVVVEGSAIENADWYPITTAVYSDSTTDTFGYTVRGYHPYIRMSFTSNAGAVTNLLAR